MTNRLLSLLFVAVLLMVGATGYQLVRSQIAADVYRQRLTRLSDQYSQLQNQYNDAVRKTAVTELLVNDGKLSVIVRDEGTVLRKIDTPFDPSSEIYADYVVVDGRLWIRRVFSENVPAKEGVTITPKWAAVDWDAQNAKVGKAVYRSLSEGRWRITVTGDGSLGLAKADRPLQAEELARAPKLGEFEPIEEKVDQKLSEIGWWDMAKRLAGWAGDGQATSDK
jgi:hypothetical protein